LPWPLPSDEATRLQLAKGYPYQAPAASYLFCRDIIVSSLPQDWHPDVFEARSPVIAHGSNRAPDQLRRKYGNLSGVSKQIGMADIGAASLTLKAAAQFADIPVTLTRLYDYEVVYSAHMTRYGAVAANLQHAPGAEVDIFITWLNPSQLQRMHDTELGGGIYRFGRLKSVRIDQPPGPLPQITDVFVYLSEAGCLRVGDRPAGLSAIPAAKRQFPALSQLEALQAVRDRLAPDRDLDDFILNIIADPLFRRDAIAVLRADAIALQAPHFEREDSDGNAS
jgi:hypothetical protein